MEPKELEQIWRQLMSSPPQPVGDWRAIILGDEATGGRLYTLTHPTLGRWQRDNQGVWLPLA